ncbi:MAG: succinate dehydrogenase, cytochrome b556 subunit [Azonexus sp.]|nr:succinate dehydrogenase, cytochrome b556 subunit [Azonexus sp.]
MTEITSKKRPKHLDLINIYFPLAAKASILHRISGAGLFLFFPVLLCLFGDSLASPEGFDNFKSIAALWPVKIVLAGLIWAFLHHFCMGIRFLLLDLHIGIGKEASRRSAAAVLAVSISLSLILWGVLL